MNRSFLLAILVLVAGGSLALSDPINLSLQIAFTGPSGPSVGKPFAYQITITNSGPGVATSIVVSNPLPATVTFVSTASNSGSSIFSNNCVFYNLAALGSGSNASVTINVRPDFAGSLTNVAWVSAVEPDSNESDNTTNKVVNVRAPYVYIMVDKDRGSISEGNSGTTNAALSVRLEALSGETVSVNYTALTTNQNTATPGLDYVPGGGTLVFTPGISNLSVSIPVIGDLLDEPSETFTVQLSNPTNALLPAVGQNQSASATIVIIDDDPPPVVSVGDATVLEGDVGTTQAAFLVTLSVPSGQQTSVRCTTIDGSAIAGSDYLGTNFVLTIPAGVTTQTVAIAVKGNTVFEGDESFTLRLSSPSNLTLGVTNGTGLIFDDDSVPGRLDHFTWNVMASPQIAGVGFEATVMAVDAFSNVVNSFEGYVPLTARGVPNNPSLPVVPTILSNFVAGIWQGTIIVSQTNSAAVLRADDGLEHAGDCVSFAVVPVPQLLLQIASSVSEGDGVIAGTARIVTDLPRTDDLPINVSISDTNQATADQVIVIPAGATNTLFHLTVVDDAILDGSQPVTITLSATNCVATNATVLIHDNETTTLSFNLPTSVMENAGVITGQIQAAQSPGMDVVVNLSSSNTNKFQVPAVVTLPAGATQVTFSVTAVNNGAIDGPQPVILTAGVSNWTPASSVVTVIDDESTNLVLSLPASVIEGQGLLNGVGTVHIGGTLAGPLTITLASADTSEVTVPSSVLIPPGATSAVFNLTVPDDALRDGTQTAQISAQASGFGAATNSVQVVDNDPASMIIGPISSPQTSGVSFPVRIQLFDINGLPAVGFQGTAVLRVWDGGAFLPVSPDVTGVFQNGEWTGNLTITGIAQQVQLMVQVAADYNDIGQPFLLKAPPIQMLNMTLVRDLVYRPQLGKAYVSVKGSHSVRPAIYLLDPETGAMQFWKDTYWYPDRLALSGDGNNLYVTFPWDAGYARYPTAGGFDVICSFGSTYIPPTAPWLSEDIEPLGQTELIAASRYLYYDGGGWRAYSHFGIAIYPQGNPLPNAFSTGGGGMWLTSSTDGQTVYTIWPGGYAQLAVTSNGVAPVRVLGDCQVPAFASGYGGDLVFDCGLLYRDNGEVVDPDRVELVGRFSTNGLVRPDSAINRVFLLATNGPAGIWCMSAYDQATYVPLGETNLSQVVGQPTRPTRCGTNTIAFVTGGEQVFLLHGLLLPTELETDLATSLQVVTPTIVLSNTTVFSLTVTNCGNNPASGLVVSARLPAALGPITVTAADGACSASNGTMICMLPLLSAGASVSVNFEVPTRMAGTFPCVASVASRATEASFTNNVSRVSLVVPPDSITPLRFSGIVPGGTGLRLQFPTLGGAPYRVECSTNLNSGSWTPVVEYLYGTGETLEVSVPNAVSLPGRFFRLALAP